MKSPGEGHLRETLGCPGKFSVRPCRLCPISRKDLNGEGRGEFHQFLSTAKASCAELRSQLYVALDVGYLDQQKFHVLLKHAEEVARIIGGLRASVAKQRKVNR